MKARIVVTLGWMLLWAVAVVGQTAPAPKVPATPTLKTDVALALKSAQNDQMKVMLQMKNLEAQYADLQKKFNEAQAKYLEVYGRALKDSGIDETKYVLDGDTLEVKPKPAPAETKKP